MKYTNGFFQLDVRKDGVFAHIYPARENGKKIVSREFFEYLDRCGIQKYDMKHLHQIISEATDECDVFVTDEIISEVNEQALVRISEDKMLAVIRFYPPSKGGKYMSEREILNELEKKKIKFGIAQKIIQAYLQGRQFCRDIPIAKGKPMVPGKDAKIDYKFDTAPTSKPKLLEDGTVDFHQLNVFIGVKKGDLLAELTPEVPGEAGMDVYGNVIKPPMLKNKYLKYGRNIQLSEDKTKLFSEVDGDVKLEGETVFVYNTYEVKADVDTSTGDIEYAGNVFVTGNVRAGFRIEASGDIEVNGVVEGAVLKAGGSIVLKRGVQGMNKAYLEAGKDIVTKFMESCTAKAGNIINTGSSLHCDLEAGQDVIVSGKKGFLIGGTVSAGKKIEASVFGNKMNTVTILKVAVEPEILERYKEVSTILKEKQEERDKQLQILESMKKKLKTGQKLLQNQLVMAKQAGEQYKVLEAEVEKASLEYNELKEEIANRTDGKVVVHHTIYPDVSVYISNKVHHVKDMRSRCQYRLVDADIIASPI